MFNEKLALILERLHDKDESVQTNAVTMLMEEARSTVGTVTSELTDLLDGIENLKRVTNKLTKQNKSILCDIISVLSVGNTDDSSHDVITYRLKGNVTDLETWGHHYVKQLVFACIKIRNREIPIINYSPLVKPICDFLFKHNSEIEAIDFLLEISDIEPTTLKNINVVPEKGTEVNMINLITEYVDDNNFGRIYLYLVELQKFYNIAHLLLELTKNKPTMHLVHLIEFRLFDRVIDYVQNIPNEDMKKQCLYILARCNISFETKETEEKNILENNFISETFIAVNENLEIMPATKIDYILKGLNTEKVDSAAVCNGLIHFGFLRDPLFKRNQGDYNIKPEYIALLNQCSSRTINASIGCIYGFNPALLIEEQPTNIFELKDLGTLLGVAIAGCKGNGNEFLFESFCEFFSSENTQDVIIALQGISLLYAGSIEHGNSLKKEKIYEKLFPLLNHNSVDVVCMTMFCISSILLSNVPETCAELYNDIFRENNLAHSSFYMHGILGMALTVYRKTDVAALERFMKLPKTVQCLAYGLMHLGSGSPDLIEEILNSVFTEEVEPLNESLGFLSAALVGLGDPLASQMIENQLMSALHLNNDHIKKVVPLSLSILYASTNKQSVIDYLERSIHSTETENVAVVALGLIGAGTKNSKITQIMSGAFNTMYKENISSNALIYAQGLINMGKGTLTLSPFVYENRVILDKPIIGLLSVVMMLMAENCTCFKENSFLQFGIAPAIRTKYVTGVDAEIKIGKPVERVGLSGKPAKLSGKVIHQAPVILNSGEAAETEAPILTEYVEDILVNAPATTRLVDKE